MNLPEVGSIYGHFKTNYSADHAYEVLAVGKHSETLEPMVAYKALYSKGNIQLGDVFFRPLEKWDILRENAEGKLVPAFKKIR